MLTMSPHISGFSYLFPWSKAVFKLRFGDKTKKFKSPQRFFSYFSLSNHTAFGQTQTGATVSLKKLGGKNLKMHM
jgi:hypothetical protein